MPVKRAKSINTEVTDTNGVSLRLQEHARRTAGRLRRPERIAAPVRRANACGLPVPPFVSVSSVVELCTDGARLTSSVYPV
jgi:hypothetical protein